MRQVTEMHCAQSQPRLIKALWVNTLTRHHPRPRKFQHMCKAHQLVSMWMYWRSHVEGRPCLHCIPLNVCQAWYLPCTKCGCLRGFFPHVWRSFETKCGAGCCTLRGVVGGDGRKCGHPPTWTEGQCCWLIGCLHLHWQGGHGPHPLRRG